MRISDWSADVCSSDLCWPSWHAGKACRAWKKKHGAPRPEHGTPMSDNCIFCKIASGEIPSKKVHEDEEFIAFHDTNPAAPVHLLLIPRRHVVSLQDIGPDDAGWLGRIDRKSVV